MTPKTNLTPNSFMVTLDIMFLTHLCLLHTCIPDIFLVQAGLKTLDDMCNVYVEEPVDSEGEGDTPAPVTGATSATMATIESKNVRDASECFLVIYKTRIKV